MEKTHLVSANSTRYTDQPTAQSGHTSLASRLTPLAANKSKADTSIKRTQNVIAETKTATPEGLMTSATSSMFKSSYPSTVVTMTNNLATIRKHSSLMAEYGGQKSLNKLISNVLKSEQHITSVLASVGDETEEINSGSGTEELLTQTSDSQIRSKQQTLPKQAARR